MVQDLKDEIWKEVEGFNGVYLISNMLRIKSIQRAIRCKNEKHRISKEKVLKHYLNSSGYYTVNLYSINKKVRPYLIHRLYANAFMENPYNKPCINHKNGVKTDNSHSNLEWCTYSENIQHAFDTGLKKAVVAKGVHSWLYGKTGVNHPCYGNKKRIGRVGLLCGASKKVRCTTLGIDFESGILAAKAFGTNQSKISRICLGKDIHIDGLNFIYV